MQDAVLPREAPEGPPSGAGLIRLLHGPFEAGHRSPVFIPAREEDARPFPVERYPRGKRIAQNSGNLTMQHDHGQEVRLVVREDGLERRPVGAAQVVHINHGDLPPGNVIKAGSTENFRVKRAQTVRPEDPVPEPASGVDEIGVFIDRLRLLPGQDEPRFENRPVEPAAIERDETAGSAQAIPEVREEVTFGAQAAQEELFRDQGLTFEIGQPNQKRIGARAAGESCGFGIKPKRVRRLGGRPGAHRLERLAQHAPAAAVIEWVPGPNNFHAVPAVR